MFNILVLLFTLFTTQVSAQNVTCATRPNTDSSNACASTAFVNGVTGVIYGVPHTWSAVQTFSAGVGGPFAWNSSGVVTSGNLPSTFCSYTAPFTGGTSRTCSSKFSDMVNLVDYGADPSGVADSTTAFNNAIARSNNVYLCGTFKLTDLTISVANLNLIGCGQNGATLIQSTTGKSNFLTINASGISFADLTVDSNGGANNTIQLNSGISNITFQRAKVINGVQQGVEAFSVSDLNVVQSTFSGSGLSQFRYRLEATKTASNLSFLNSTFDGSGVATPFTSLYIVGAVGASGSVTDIRIVGNQIKTKSLATGESDGLVLSNALSNANSMSRVTISGNTISCTDIAGSGACYGIELASVTDFAVTGNTIEYAFPAIIAEKSPSGSLTSVGVISGNLIRPNSAGTGGTGIYIIQGQVVVNGNKITSPGYPSGYGIVVNEVSAGDNAGTIVVGNAVTVGTSGVGINVQSNDIYIASNTIDGASNAQGIKTAGTSVSNVMIRNNSIRSVFYGVLLSATTHVNSVVANNSFTSVSSPLFTLPTSGVLILDDSNSNGAFNFNSPFGDSPTTIANLPSCGATLQGRRRTVSDASAPAWGSAVVGGGVVTVGVMCDGVSSWIVR